MGVEIEEIGYHVEIVRDKLTRSLPAIFPDVLDELTLAIGEHVTVEGNGTRCLTYHFIPVFNASPNVYRVDSSARHDHHAEGYRPGHQSRVCWDPALSVSGVPTLTPV